MSKDRCPHCGYCPHCGRSNDYYRPRPWYPYTGPYYGGGTWSSKGSSNQQSFGGKITVNNCSC